MTEVVYMPPSAPFRCWYCFAIFQTATDAVHGQDRQRSLLRFIDLPPFVQGQNDTELCAWHAIVNEGARSSHVNG